MYVKIKYYRPEENAYMGKEYIYQTSLPASVGDIVMCPTYKGPSKGIIARLNVSAAEIDEKLKAQIKEITEFYLPEEKGE